MCDKNINKSPKEVLMKSVPKCSDGTKVFVLPPELLKGLINRSKKLTEAEDNSTEKFEKSQKQKDRGFCSSYEKNEEKTIQKNESNDLRDESITDPETKNVKQLDKADKKSVQINVKYPCKDKSTKSDSMDIYQTSQTEATSTVIPDENQLSLDYIILNENSHGKVQHENETTDGKDYIEYEEIEFIVEEIVDEPVSTKVAVESQILNHINLSDCNVENISSDNIIKINKNDSLEQFARIAENEEKTEKTKIVRTYTNKRKLKSQITNSESQTESLENNSITLSNSVLSTIKTSSRVTPKGSKELTTNLKNIPTISITSRDLEKKSELETSNININEVNFEKIPCTTNVIKTNDPSKSSHFHSTNDFRNMNEKTCQSSNIDVKNSSPKFMNSASVDDVKTLKNESIKNVKSTNLFDVKMQKDASFSSKSTDSENIMSDGIKSTFDLCDKSENVNLALNKTFGSEKKDVFDESDLPISQFETKLSQNIIPEKSSYSTSIYDELENVMDESVILKKNQIAKIDQELIEDTKKSDLLQLSDDKDQRQKNILNNYEKNPKASFFKSKCNDEINKLDNQKEGNGLNENNTCTEALPETMEQSQVNQLSDQTKNDTAMSYCSIDVVELNNKTKKSSDVNTSFNDTINYKVPKIIRTYSISYSRKDSKYSDDNAEDLASSNKIIHKSLASKINFCHSNPTKQFEKKIEYTANTTRESDMLVKETGRSVKSDSLIDDNSENLLLRKKRTNNYLDKVQIPSDTLENSEENVNENLSLLVLETSTEVLNKNTGNLLEHNGITKKRRGRPPKTRVSTNNIINNNVSNEATNNLGNDCKVEKFIEEPIGQDKNNVVCTIKCEVTSDGESVVTNSVPKKRRGRPPKVRVSYENAADTKLSKLYNDSGNDSFVGNFNKESTQQDEHNLEYTIKSEVMSDEGSTVSNGTLKKRRGRPPIIRVSNSSTTDNELSNKVVSHDLDNDCNLNKFMSETPMLNVSNLGCNTQSVETSNGDTQLSNDSSKKRRGKPRRNRVTSNNVTNDELTDIIINKDLGGDSNVEKFTQESIQLGENNACKSEEILDKYKVPNSTSKKRRGKPPKIRVSESQMSDDKLSDKIVYDDLGNDSDEEKLIDEATKPNENNLECDSKFEETLNTDKNTEVLNSALKKRRGRPPKKKSRFDNPDDKFNEDTRDINLAETLKSKLENVSIKIENNVECQDNVEEISEHNDTPIKQIGRRSKAYSLSAVSPDCSDSHENSGEEDYSKNKNMDQRNVRKSGRGRPLKSNEIVSDDSSKGDEANADKKKRFSLRDRTNKQKITLQKSDSDDNRSFMSEPDVTDDLSSASEGSRVVCKKKKYTRVNVRRKRGRPKTNREEKKSDNDYVPDRLQSSRSSRTNKLKLDTSTESNKLSSVLVKCGKCHAELKKSLWSHHNLSAHNDLAWLEGTENPNYDNDEKLLKKVLVNAIKKRKAGLICENCLDTKRSVVGYLSHIMFCGKNDDEIRSLMVTCPECNAMIKPSSLEYHERIHKQQAEQKKLSLDVSLKESAENDAGQKSKRKAAEKATVKILEITELVKGDKDNLTDKTLKVSKSLKNIIQVPTLKRKVPGIVLKKWKQEILNNQNTSCNQVGCQFSSKELDEMINHYSTCNFTPHKNYCCKICQYQSTSEAEIVKHANENHFLEDNADPNLSLSDEEPNSDKSENIQSESESESESRKKPSKSSVYKKNKDLCSKRFKFVHENVDDCFKYSTTYYNAFIWTLNSELQNYKFHLFDEFTPKVFKLLDSKEGMNYIPEHEESMATMNKVFDTRKSNTETKWKKWKRFEGQCVQDNPTFFTGGPVWAIAWLPIPTYLTCSEDVNEFIAVSTHTNMDKAYSVGKAHSGKNVIQIWNVGFLDYKNKNATKPKLAYAITHEGGTVWCMEWCPSGCYEHEKLPGFIEKDDQTKRMGLLAAACSDGSIRVYSLIFPEGLPHVNQHFIKTENQQNQYPIYDTEPSIVLVTNLQMYDNKRQTWQVTKLSWTKEDGHSVIAAGFSNGYVALWNLVTKSPMLRTKRGNTTFLMPYRHFPAHLHAVTMVCLVAQDNHRFLATGSMDRLYKFWDLEDITSPKNTFKKGIISDGAWLNHWCCSIITCDDALNNGHNYVNCLPLRDYTYKFFNLLPTNSPSFTVSASDFGNSVACGTLAGEVLAIFPYQLLYIASMEKTLMRKRLHSIVSSVEIVDFENEKERTTQSENHVNVANRKKKTDCDLTSLSYSEVENRFGLKFCDKMANFQKEWYVLKKSQRRKTLACEAMEEVPLEQYPFMAVNRVSWSPNARSFLWLAVGYQNGFIRLIPFKAKNSDTALQWDNLLKKHVKKLETQEKQSTIVL